MPTKDEIEELLNQAPLALEAPLSPSEINEEIVLHRGDLELVQGKEAHTVAGRIGIRWTPELYPI